MLSLEQQNALREQYRRRRPHWQPATERYAALVGSYLMPQARLLDLGCGRGGLLEQLAHPLAQTVGVDADVASLRHHRLPDLPRSAAYSDRLPFANGRFDVVMASWVLEHLQQPRATLRDVQRVLRPGGVFVFITPNARHPLSLLNRSLGRLGRWQGHLVTRLYGREVADTFPTAYRANSAATLQRLCAVVGLRMAVLQTVPDPTYLAFTPALFRLASYLEERLPPQRNIHLVGVLQRPACS